MGVKRDGTPRIVQRWAPDVETWDLARRAWEMRVNGASYREVHEATGLLGSIGSYATFFRNRIYTGTLVYGGAEYKDFVPRLIPDEWFERVQAMRRRRFQHTPRHRTSDYLSYANRSFRSQGTLTTENRQWIVSRSRRCTQCSEA